MNKRRLGRTDLHVSEFCLNTEKFGWINDEATATALLDTYYNCGGSFLQNVGHCASTAVAPVVDCASEDVVGRWQQKRGIMRHSVVLATRLALVRPAHGGSIAFANLIREACERSLRRLRTRYLDLLVCDWDEQLVPFDDVLEAVERLVRAGLVRFAVAGGFPPWRVVDSLHRSHMRNQARFEALQAEYSLLACTRFEAEALAMCREHRLGFVARSPLAGGFLAHRPTALHEFIRYDRSWQNERFGNRTGDAVLTALATVAEKRLASPAQIALAWVLRDPQVTSALVAPTSVYDLCALLRTGSMTLTDEEARTLEAVTAGRGCRMGLRHA